MSEKPTPDEVLDALQTARTYLGERRFEDGAVIGGSRVSYREIHDALAAAMRRAEEPTVERDDARGTAAAFIALTEELWPAVNEYERAHADPHRPDPARRSTATAQLRTVLSHLRSWAYDDDKLRATREAAEAEATALRERVAALGGGLSDAERHLFMASHAMHQAAAWIVAEADIARGERPSEGTSDDERREYLGSRDRTKAAAERARALLTAPPAAAERAKAAEEIAALLDRRHRLGERYGQAEAQADVDTVDAEAVEIGRLEAAALARWRAAGGGAEEG